MITDYHTFIINVYRRKLAANSLRQNLLVPTPGKLRAECLLVFKERYDEKDAEALRMFFGTPVYGNTYAEEIPGFDVDKFRPLVKLLKGQIKETEHKNIELLAWLMDEPRRPYRKGEVYSTEPDVPASLPTEGAIEDVPQVAVDLPIVVGSGRSKKRPTIFMSIVAALIVVLAAATYIFWPNPSVGVPLRYPYPPPLTGNCMAWVGDHYIVIPCDQQKDHQGLLGIDSSRLIRFRRITDTLAINENMVGKVWYFKNKDKMEYYSGPGYHPIDTARWLKPLTTYIVRKYLKHPVH